jgi:hypothetical protein
MVLDPNSTNEVLDVEGKVRRMMAVLNVSALEVELYFEIRDRQIAEFGDFDYERVVAFPMGMTRFRMIFDAETIVLVSEGLVDLN